MTDSDVLDVVLEPDLNCGTTGVANTLIGYINTSSSESLVNFYANSSRSNTASTTSTSSTGMDSRAKTRKG